MSEVRLPRPAIGNEFMVPAPQLQAASISSSAGSHMEIPIISAISTTEEYVPVKVNSKSNWQNLVDLFHKNSVIVFALMLLIVGTGIIEVGGNYYKARITNQAKPVATSSSTTKPIAGFNLTVPSSELATKIQSITAQPVSVMVGTINVPISADMIKSWISVTPSSDKTKDYLRVEVPLMSSSIHNIVNQYVKAPVSQVTINDSSGASVVILPGANGVQLTDPSGLDNQILTSAKSVMNGSGLSFNAPTGSQAFSLLTPCNFSKLLVASVTAKQLTAYQGCQAVNTFPSTNGAPATPTPIGEFHIWEKLTSQTMTGFNPNGTKYVQPNVPYINYFDYRGDAVHGNYWRPASVFGNINTSHGCVGIPVSDGAWVYNWAPIGTTVITTEAST